MYTVELPHALGIILPSTRRYITVECFTVYIERTRLNTTLLSKQFNVLLRTKG